MTSGLLGRRGVVENAIEIEATADAVFDYCADVRREPEWNPKLLEGREAHGGSDWVGNTIQDST
jgi:hypothetical protein